MDYFNATQSSGKSFSNWRAKKLQGKAQCELTKSMSFEDLDVLELICVVQNYKLRQEMLKLKTPKAVQHSEAFMIEQ